MDQVSVGECQRFALPRGICTCICSKGERSLVIKPLVRGSSPTRPVVGPLSGSPPASLDRSNVSLDRAKLILTRGGLNGPLPLPLYSPPR